METQKFRSYTYVTTGICIQMNEGQAIADCSFKKSITQTVYTFV